MFEKLFAKSEKKWEETHYQPSEIILAKAKQLEDPPTDHAIVLAILDFLDEEVGSARKREDNNIDLSSEIL